MKASNKALLVMDIQEGIAQRYANSADFFTPFQQAIKAAREANIPVIYVRIAFRDGYPEVSAKNKMFSAISQNGGFTETASSTQIHAAVAPEHGDAVVIKRRVSAFSGSDLDVVLRAQQIDTLILMGIATSGVVLSTVREAADRDYSLVVLSDACIDADPEVQRVLMEKVFPRQADVMSVRDWVARILL
ncbi:cysteine hydrolase [Fodinisporobacter ferrooxydans]|uniref:Cysteine hydrolase n=1 Tax=Fodinisporobacter ferrooxydans TaxID=2901836 RepID=A0ABY4CL59_9BACL|nr:cysteine hydrolase [Alicyclobacillaceae bacterium MYW30-H2]